MAPMFPRMHLFEIDDQPWFPSFLRARVQTALTITWNLRLPFFQTESAAQKVARLLTTHLSPVDRYGFIDFCAGGGGPTPEIERAVNSGRASGRRSAAAAVNGDAKGSSSSSQAGPGGAAPVPFVLTDLHPNIAQWAGHARRSPNVTFEPAPVDASAASPSLLARVKEGDLGGGRPRRTPRRLFRLFNLAFHHFDDPLARAILKDTVETSDGFGIFEMQGRRLGSFLMMLLFFPTIVLCTPYHALVTGDVLVPLLFTWLVPVIPFVLSFDGVVSSLRTRTPDEVEALLRSCGAEGAENWEIKSGHELVFPPTGYMYWIICVKKE